MPSFDEMLRFSVCDLWPLIKGRTLWIMGDSHSYDLFHALGCLVLPVRFPATAVVPLFRREVSKRLLSPDGISVCCACTHPTATLLFTSSHFSLVLLLVHMRTT